jgi:hypothetical protein
MTIRISRVLDVPGFVALSTNGERLLWESNEDLHHFSGLFSTLRSALWDLVQAIDLNNPYALFLIAASAATGKVLGGWMISRFPRAHHVSLVMLAACLLLEIGRGQMAGLCAGIALLQSTIPASIILLRRTFGATPAMAAAYGLGVTVALGGLIVPESAHTSGLGIGLAVVVIVLFGLSLRKERRLRLAG